MAVNKINKNRLKAIRGEKIVIRFSVTIKLKIGESNSRLLRGFKELSSFILFI